ncbi:MAG: serine/threonine protein kinase, partial [Cyanobacteria bacterium NC_groundwater_1444_Ag_S-0.65um_54_12]|nr:serine/threonine protein kinase [Cyanobacteria bacterium NC_groundwater_1444_Ag_S-0.65um_54_12]
MEQIANRYAVLAVLGEGGMGQVLQVKDLATGQELALKLLKTATPEALTAPVSTALEKTTASTLGKGLQREFWAMTRLCHPRLVKVFDYGVLPDGIPFFTMEMLRGTSLAKAIPLASEQVKDLLVKLCDPLGYIHSRGFVHGDLKPENICLLTSGDIKLLDFGLARRNDWNQEVISGTLNYLAPEMIRGGPGDARADLYSLGAVCYHLLVGQPPFTGDSAVEILKKHLYEPPLPPSSYVACPPELESIILKLLAKDPLERQQSSAAVTMALGHVTIHDQPAILVPSFIGRQNELARLVECCNSLGTPTG